MSFCRSVLVFCAALIISFLTLLPGNILSFFSRFMAYSYKWYARKESKQLHENIHKILRLPEHSSFARDFANQVIYHQFMSSFESLKAIWSDQKIRIDGVEEYRRVLSSAIDKGNGLIIVTAHIGSWELLSKVSGECLRPRKLTVLAKPARQKFVTILLDRLRAKSGIGVLWLGSKSLMKDMLKTLSAKDALGFVMDQKPQGRVGTPVDFYGHRAEFVRGPAQIACKSSVPVVAAFCLRIAPMHYKVVFYDVLEGYSSDQEAILTKTLVQSMEKIVRMYPEQWCWNYKRWKFFD